MIQQTFRGKLINNQHNREERDVSTYPLLLYSFSSLIHKLFPLTVSDEDIHSNTAVRLHSVSSPHPFLTYEKHVQTLQQIHKVLRLPWVIRVFYLQLGRALLSLVSPWPFGFQASFYGILKLTEKKKKVKNKKKFLKKINLLTISYGDEDTFTQRYFILFLGNLIFYAEIRSFEAEPCLPLKETTLKKYRGGKELLMLKQKKI